MKWIGDLKAALLLEIKRGGDIEVECDTCHERYWIKNDPTNQGAGYPYGWQFVLHKCGGTATPVGSET